MPNVGPDRSTVEQMMTYRICITSLGSLQQFARDVMHFISVVIYRYIQSCQMLVLIDPQSSG